MNTHENIARAVFFALCLITAFAALAKSNFVSELRFNPDDLKGVFQSREEARGNVSLGSKPGRNNAEGIRGRSNGRVDTFRKPATKEHEIEAGKSDLKTGRPR